MVHTVGLHVAINSSYGFELVEIGKMDAQSLISSSISNFKFDFLGRSRTMGVTCIVNQGEKRGENGMKC